MIMTMLHKHLAIMIKQWESISLRTLSCVAVFLTSSSYGIIELFISSILKFNSNTLKQNDFFLHFILLRETTFLGGGRF